MFCTDLFEILITLRLIVTLPCTLCKTEITVSAFRDSHCGGWCVDIGGLHKWMCQQQCFYLFIFFGGGGEFPLPNKFDISQAYSQLCREGQEGVGLVWRHATQRLHGSRVKSRDLLLSVISKGSCNNFIFWAALPMLSASMHNTLTVTLPFMQYICCSHMTLVSSIQGFNRTPHPPHYRPVPLPKMSIFSLETTVISEPTFLWAHLSFRLFLLC